MQQPHQALVGSLVHRLFEARVRAGDDVLAAARAALRDEERAVLDDADGVLAAAAAIWTSMTARDDVAALLAAPTVHAEVPFSLRLDAADGEFVVRGTIDCVAIGADGGVTVVEFKTGGAHPSHQLQLDLYVEAARALFPGSDVSGRLIYNSDAQTRL